MKRALLRILICWAILAVPLRAWADEPKPVHRYADDRLPPPSARTNLILLGAGITAGFYLPVLGASYLWPDSRGAADSRIPLAGPWMQVAQTKTCARDPNAPRDCNDFARIFGAILLALDGVGQAGGVGLMVQGLFLHTAPLTPRTTSGLAAGDWNHFSQVSHRRRLLTYSSGDFEVSARPTSIPGADFGMGLVGRF
jgi:hypothetical protein